ncbi:hypothetical protein E1B28_013247 [Marasmius oreades]|uniref:C2H2-type domain-containing protein n=1 Tax=Marasmius oreades TaxID=181124 RepID=A0A9P7RQL3_9AGAR|nr:uncharacterized protein E1B28_013247 [Marasmius oreades]KAG7087268.1 hypothetical protein E1B28_013247 [Marasmius oreades]
MNAFNDLPDLSFLSEPQYPEFDDHTDTISNFTQIWKQEPSEVDFEQRLAQIHLEFFGVAPLTHLPAPSAVDFEELFESSELPGSASSPIEVNNAVLNVSDNASYPGSHESIARLVEASTTRYTLVFFLPIDRSLINALLLVRNAQVSAAVTQPIAVKNPSTLQTPSFSWPFETPGFGNVLNFGSPSAPQDEQWFNTTSDQYANVENFWNSLGCPSFQYQYQPDQGSENLQDFFYPEVAQPFPHPLPNPPTENPSTENPHEQVDTYDAAAFSYCVSDGGIPPCDDSFPLFNNFDFTSQNQQQHIPVDPHPRPMIFGWPGPDIDLPPDSIPGLSTSARLALTSRGCKRKRSPSSCDETDYTRSPSSSASSHGNNTCLWMISDSTSGTWVTCGETLSEKGLSTHLNTHLISTRHGGDYDVSKRMKCKWGNCQEEYQASETYRHVRKHLGWSKVQCGKCGKVLARKDSLKRHSAQCRGKKV